jgi:lipoprotein-anchoring transpeptidase ErfK/SrfK
MYYSRLILLLSLIVTIQTGALRAEGDTHHEIIVSVKDQQLMLKTDGKPEAIYPVSTSKFGIGDRWGSYATPLGKLFVKVKIGMGRPLGTVFKSRVPTGEVLKPNAPGRDPIVSRILWLDGVEPCNRNAFNRGIYIHGTPEEKLIGRPASFGCIRMKSSDVIALCDKVAAGAAVKIIPDHFPERAGLGGILNTHRLIAANTRTPESPSEREAE